MIAANMLFPIAHRAVLPSHEFLPPTEQRYSVGLSPSYVKKREPHTIHLLSAGVHLLLPEARVSEIEFHVFPNNLVAKPRVET